MKRWAVAIMAIGLIIGGCATTNGNGRGSGAKVELALAAKVILDVEESDQRGIPKRMEGHAALAALVSAVAISPDGRYAASGLSDKTIMLWDISSGTCMHILSGHRGSVISLAFSHDNRQLASGGMDGTVVRWDILTGKEISSHKDASEPVNALAFSQNDKVLISANHKQEIYITGISPGGMNGAFKVGERSSAGTNLDFTPYAFSGDGRHVLTVHEGVSLSLWDVTARREVKKISGDYGTITALAFSPDGRRALVGNSRGRLKLIDIGADKEILTFSGHSGLVRSVAFSTDGKNAFSGSYDETVKMWDTVTGKEIRTFRGHANNVRSIAVAPDGLLLISGSTDTTSRIWNVKTGQEIVTMVKFIKYLPPMFMKADVAAREDEFKDLRDAWVILTPDGYYAGSASALGNMKVTKGAWFYLIDQFYDVFYRPDIIAARLHGEDTTGLVTLTMEDALKNPPPEVKLSNVPRNSGETTLKIKYKVESNGGGIGEIRIFHNGKLVKSDGYYRETKRPAADKVGLAYYSGQAVREEMRSIVIAGRQQGKASMIEAPPKGDSVAGEVAIHPVPGENEVGIAAFNKDNTVQSMIKTATFASTLKAEEPRLFVLSVGIDEYKASDENLRFAVKDAESFARLIETESLTQYKASGIHVRILKNGEATKSGIKTAIAEMTRAVKPNDVFLFFIAGHGVLHGGLYAIVTHDFGGSLHQDCLITSNEIMELSKDIKSLKQIFILDTCHAGGLDTFIGGLYDARMSVLARNMGLHMFASASSTQKALDGFKGKNGMFTYALLEALDNNRSVDANKDGRVSIYELGSYAKMLTIKYSRESGYQQTPVVNNFGKDVPVYILH
ncbi:MAG: caspase family protein [Pseudomonadota bacterium]|nr:caspase family protein [Pseudomonadota bacterium]